MKELEKIAEAKSRLMACVKEDLESEAIDAIADLLSAQAQSDIEEVEVCVPTKSVIKNLDLGTLRMAMTGQGFLFQAKGSLSVLIDPRQKGLSDMMEELMEGIENGFESVEDENDREMRKAFAQAWLYILQSPIFCYLSPEIAAESATVMLKGFNAKAQELISAELAPETPKENADFIDIIDSTKE